MVADFAMQIFSYFYIVMNWISFTQGISNDQIANIIDNASHFYNEHITSLTYDDSELMVLTVNYLFSP